MGTARPTECVVASVGLRGLLSPPSGPLGSLNSPNVRLRVRAPNAERTLLGLQHRARRLAEPTSFYPLNRPAGQVSPGLQVPEGSDGRLQPSANTPQPCAGLERRPRPLCCFLEGWRAPWLRVGAVPWVSHLTCDSVSSSIKCRYCED